MPEQNKVTNKKLLLLLLAIIGVSALLYFAFFKQEEPESLNTDCFITKQRTIKGISMSPLFENGEEVTTYENYYDCNEIQRGDIVIFNFKTRDGDFLKKIRGMPNDLLEFEEVHHFLSSVRRMDNLP